MEPTTATLPGTGAQHLLAGVRGWTCAFRLGDVLEVMRPLPVQPLQGLPAWVLGVALHRGRAVPALELGLLLGGGVGAASLGRWVVVQGAGRKLVLAVERVVGIRTLDPALLAPLPPLLRAAPQEALAALGTVDDLLLMVLESARLLPEDVWTALESPGGDR